MNKYTAFSLVELLLVMIIVMALFGISISGFAGLRDSVVLKEDANSFYDDIRWAQRAALLVKQDSGERWLNGIGIDLRFMDGSTSSTTASVQDGFYRMFKWCSETQEFPGSTDVAGFSQQEVNDISKDSGASFLAPSLTRVSGGDCSRSDSTPEDHTIPITERGGYEGWKKLSPALQVGLAWGPNESTFNAGNSNGVRFIVFQAVTGKVFAFDAAGALIFPYEYSSNNYTSSTEPNYLHVLLKSPNRDEARPITINVRSGKAFLNDTIEVDGLNFIAVTEDSLPAYTTKSAPSE